MGKQLLYEINTRYWLYELRNKYDQKMTLASIPENELVSIVSKGFDWIWLMGVFDHTKLDQDFLKTHPGLITEIEEAVDDWNIDDVIGSPYSIKTYDIHPILGTNEDFQVLRKRFNGLGIKVMVDFVPNHFGIHTPYAFSNPDYFINLIHEPPEDQQHLFTRIETHHGQRWIAHGKDPYFPPWDDTWQINIFNPDTREFMQQQLMNLAEMADGVRCDMAMLINNDIMEQSWGWLLEETWSRPEKEFWPSAIESIKQSYPDFLFLAEVYWDMEWDLLEMGFDYTYDKRLYDRLISTDINPIHEHIHADLTYQVKMCRFLENHDEQRVLQAMDLDQSLAAAVIITTLPGMTLIHHGQITGQKIFIPVQLLRKRSEPVNEELLDCYHRIFEYNKEIPQAAIWQHHDVTPISALPSDTILTWSWQTQEEFFVIAVNYGNYQADVLIPLNTQHPVFQTGKIEFVDKKNGNIYSRKTDSIANRGLYVKLDPFDYHLFTVSAI